MIRTPMNVWRVYVDLLSNFMGLVLVGGAGLMVMVGGAAVHSHLGSSPFATACAGGREVTGALVAGGIKLKGEFRNVSTGADGGQAFRRLKGCEIEVRYPRIAFQSGLPRDPSAAGGVADKKARTTIAQDAGALNAVKDTLPALCRATYEAIRFAKYVQQDARVEIVGRASEDFKELSTCKLDATVNADWLRTVMRGSNDPGHKAFVQELLANMNGADTANKNFCNSKLGMRRADFVVNHCLSELIAMGDQFGDRSSRIGSEDFFHYAAEVSDITTSAEVCASRKRAEDRNACLQTVTLRIRLPPRADYFSNAQ